MTENHDGLDDLGHGDIEIPDDLSGLAGASAEPEFVALITQIAGAEPLAAACALAQIDADAVPTEIGALAVLRQRSGDASAQAAAALTTLVKGVPVILVVRSHEQLTMTRWLDGEAGDQLAPGLVLGGAPQAVEDLLVGTTTLDGLPGVVASDSISRFKAMRLLTSAARKARRK